MAVTAIIIGSFLYFMRCIYMLMTVTSTGINLKIEMLLQGGSEV